jgi:N-acetyl-anhydromuramoyl-L-alanine amidase
MAFAQFTELSPHFSPTLLHEKFGVVFHHSVMPFDATIALMCGATRPVSYHCLIAPDGRRCTLVEDDHVAWHAGASTFNGRSRCNDFMLGVAFAGDTYAEPLTSDQLASALEWLDSRWRRYGWSEERMTDHRQVAPERKNDLNPVEWERLRRSIAERFGVLR